MEAMKTEETQKPMMRMSIAEMREMWNREGAEYTEAEAQTLGSYIHDLFNLAEAVEEQLTSLREEGLLDIMALTEAHEALGMVEMGEAE